MEGRIIFFSPGAERMLGISAREIVGLPVQRLYENGREEAQKIMKMLMAFGSFSDHATVVVGKNKRVHVSMSGAFLKDKTGKRIGTLGISKDVTERVELERRLRELSITDNLTGLFNQRHFRERAQAEVQRAKRQRSKLSLILIDLDRFKRINDDMGHLHGDRILRRTAETISQSIRGEVDAAFRYGGDEFIVLLPSSGLKKGRDGGPPHPAVPLSLMRRNLRSLSASAYPVLGRATWWTICSTAPMPVCTAQRKPASCPPAEPLPSPRNSPGCIPAVAASPGRAAISTQ